MSGLLMGHAFYEELPPLQKLLLLAIADHANDDGYGAYPSQNRLAEKVGCSTRHINTLTGALVSVGLVEITERGDGRGNTTHYLLPWAKDVARRAKGEKAEQTTTKGEVQSSSDPSLEPSSTTESSDLSDPRTPPQAASLSAIFPQAATIGGFYAAEKASEVVAALVDIAKANGREVCGGRVAALVKRHGKNRTRLLTAFMEAIARNVAVIEDYVEGTLRNGQEHEVSPGGEYGERGRDRRLAPFTPGIEATFLTAEDEAILAARARDGVQAAPEDSGAVPEGRDAGDRVQQPGDGDG